MQQNTFFELISKDPRLHNEEKGTSKPTAHLQGYPQQQHGVGIWSPLPKWLSQPENRIANLNKFSNVEQKIPIYGASFKPMPKDQSLKPSSFRKYNEKPTMRSLQEAMCERISVCDFLEINPDNSDSNSNAAWSDISISSADYQRVKLPKETRLAFCAPLMNKRNKHFDGNGLPKLNPFITNNNFEVRDNSNLLQNIKARFAVPPKVPLKDEKNFDTKTNKPLARKALNLDNKDLEHQKLHQLSSRRGSHNEQKQHDAVFYEPRGSWGPRVVNKKVLLNEFVNKSNKMTSWIPYMKSLEPVDNIDQSEAYQSNQTYKTNKTYRPRNNGKDIGFVSYVRKFKKPSDVWWESWIDEDVALKNQKTEEDQGSESSLDSAKTETIATSSSSDFKETSFDDISLKPSENLVWSHWGTSPRTGGRNIKVPCSVNILCKRGLHLGDCEVEYANKTRSVAYKKVGDTCM